ncbi:MAG TPA: transglutaminase-like domain-containing protein [Marmoricola sp.]|nr:transglutaminase-like domain-containing protein [Marmoricola sp.]
MSRDDRSVDLVPKGSALLDLLMVLALGTVCMYGFRDTFADWTYLAAGALGLLLGSLVAHVALVLRQPAVVTAVFTIAAFFLLGGAVALRGDGALSALPVPHTLSLLADQSVHGWKELLTTLPPVDSGALLSLPYLLGLVAGAAGTTVAGLRWPVGPVLVELALLSTVILLGVQTPHSVVTLGSVFGVLAIAWSVLRARRLQRTTRFERRRIRRGILATALCAAAGGLAVVAGPALPGVGQDRVVLRSHVTPPFDVGQYPSPLASFRRYTDGVKPEFSLEKAPLVKVTGVKPGTLVRFATLDDYNGSVWGAANDAGTDPGLADTFQKVGSSITNPLHGRAVHARMTLESGYSGVWLPVVGGLRHLDFTSPRLRQSADDFRYNLASSTAVVPGGLRPGDTYDFDAVIPPDAEPTAKTATAGAPLVSNPSTALFQADAVRLSSGGEGASPMGQVLAVADKLRTTGTFTHGATGFEEYRAGHSVSRLKDFLSTDKDPAGDDEQYAAAMALLANDLGVPARVVLGAALPESGEIHGSDVHAWVELRAQDGTWRTLPTSKFMSTDKPPVSHKQKDPQLQPGITVPPPVPVRPPATVGDPAPDSLSHRADAKHGFAFSVPWYVVAVAKYVGTPLALVAAVLAGIVLAKRRRRTLRRTRGTPAKRLVAAYRELLDQARDLGHRVHAGRTRREQARDVGVDRFLEMARTADAHVFGAADPTDEVAAAYWADVDDLRSELTSSLSRWGRLKVAVNLSSFTPLRRRGVEA